MEPRNPAGSIFREAATRLCLAAHTPIALTGPSQHIRRTSRAHIKRPADNTLDARACKTKPPVFGFAGSLSARFLGFPCSPSVSPGPRRSRPLYGRKTARCWPKRPRILSPRIQADAQTHNNKIHQCEPRRSRPLYGVFTARNITYHEFFRHVPNCRSEHNERTHGSRAAP